MGTLKLCGIITIAIIFTCILIICVLFKTCKFCQGIKNKSIKISKNSIQGCKDYLKYLRNIIKKSPIAVSGTLFLSTAIYIYTLNLFAYEGLFHINKNFFIEDSIELKLWTSLFSFSHIFFSKNAYAILILLLVLILISSLPFYIISTINQLATSNIEVKSETKPTSNKQSIIRFLNSALNYLAMFLAKMVLPVFTLATTLLIFYSVTGAGITALQNEYILHSQYCQIVNGESNPRELIISENPSVPYKLIFTESQIIYFQPNQPRATWKEYNESEIIFMHELCNKQS